MNFRSFVFAAFAALASITSICLPSLAHADGMMQRPYVTGCCAPINYVYIKPVVVKHFALCQPNDNPGNWANICNPPAPPPYLYEDCCGRRIMATEERLVFDPPYRPRNPWRIREVVINQTCCS